MGPPPEVGELTSGGFLLVHQAGCQTSCTALHALEFTFIYCLPASQERLPVQFHVLGRNARLNDLQPSLPGISRKVDSAPMSTTLAARALPSSRAMAVPGTTWSRSVSTP